MEAIFIFLHFINGFLLTGIVILDIEGGNGGSINTFWLVTEINHWSEVDSK